MNNKPVLCNFIIIDSEPIPDFESKRLRYLPFAHGYLYVRLFEYEPKSRENNYGDFFNKMVRALPKELRDKNRMTLLGFACYIDKSKLYFHAYDDFDEKIFTKSNLHEIEKYVQSVLPPPREVILEKLIPCVDPFYGLASDSFKLRWWRLSRDLSSDMHSILGSDSNPSSIRDSFMRKRGELMKPSWLYCGSRRKEAERRRKTKYEKEIKQSLLCFRKVGIKTKPGMNNKEILAAEKCFNIRFPEDLRAFLKVAVPVSVGFCDWTNLSKENVTYIQNKIETPFLAIIYHASRKQFWPKTFGARPRKRQERVEVVKERLLLAPKLIPVFGDYYISSKPLSDSNPVFYISMDYMREDSCGDVRAPDIWHFFERKFKDYEKFVTPSFERKFAKKIPFWSRII